MKHLAAAFLVIPLSGCFAVQDICKNDIIGEIPSPDGQWKAIVFKRDCGATTASSTQVSVLPTQLPLANEAGNLFVVDDNHGAAPSRGSGGPNVEVKWLDAKKLKIVYDHRARTFAKEKHYQDISISYSTK